MSKVKRKTDYLFQRPGSQNWYVKLQSPTGRVEHSLRTSDRREAEIIAGPMVTAHKAALLAARPRFERPWVHKLEPNREHVGPDGARILATDRELFHIGQNGSITRTEPNGQLGYQLVGGPLTVHSLVKAHMEAFGDASGRPTVPTKNADDAILQTYLDHRNIVGYDRREAETVWALFKSLCDKPLKDASRDDGRLLVQRFKDEGNKSATITKKVGWLRAAVEYAIDENKLTFNPFSNIVPKNDDEQERLPLSDVDMRACKRNLAKLSEADQLLFRLLTTTGCRLSEAFEIDGELKEKGVRYVVIGSKTEASRRRLPLPADLLSHPHLPKKIAGPLFTGETRAASKRLNRFLNDCGIVDPAKVVHSLRHRAQDRLRAAGCQQDIREALLGHSKVTVGESYGAGFPVPLLRKWIDRIGF